MSFSQFSRRHLSDISLVSVFVFAAALLSLMMIDPVAGNFGLTVYSDSKCTKMEMVKMGPS